MPASESLNTTIFGAALDALTAGVVLSGRDGQVHYMNAAAARQAKTGGAFRLSNSRILPADRAAERAFISALSNIEPRRLGEPASGYTLALPDRRGAGVLATILRLDSAAAGGSSEYQTPAAAIFIQDPTILPPCPGDAFAALYGLTRSEVRVALTLMRCQSLQEVGSQLGLSVLTVKTHLQHIFQKTGTSRQADLLALMWRATGPARLA